MNSVKFSFILGGVSKNKIILIFLLATLSSVYLAGCGDKIRLPSAEQLTEFDKAGPSGPVVDMERVVGAKIEAGPYRVVSGDVLELSMPIVLQAIVTEVPDFPDKIAPYLCRVGDDGVIVLPMVGQIQAAGKTLPEIESVIIDAYYPTYTRMRPSVIARVAEYKTYKATITGAVGKPGLYELRSDQMSLVALLMQAGGIIDEGATRIRITRTDRTDAGFDKQALSQSTKYQGVRFASHYPGANEADGVGAQMTFQLVSPSSTIGRLTIKHEQTILLSEQLDITNEIQRWAILDKLAEKKPSVATAEVGKIWVRLCQLSDLLLERPNEDFQPLENTKQPDTIKPGKLSNHETLVLPVKGLNILFTDVALNAGDIVEVELLEVSMFTVVGLVNKPGNFPYPPNAQYNLMQAIAFAGGLDRNADPRYATIYRLKADGSIVSTPFQLITTKKGSQLTDALNIPIKPGDIVAVEDTLRTRTNEFLRRIFNVHVGAYVPLVR